MINLTQHLATPEQSHEGVIDFVSDTRKALSEFLTFNDISETEQSEMEYRADRIVKLIPDDQKSALIGGALYFMPYLIKALRQKGITPYYSFTKRDIIEKQSDSMVVKTAIFKHVGFIEAI
jgi:hypothetical protein